MRASLEWNNNVPVFHCYAGEKSTAKRIELLIYEQLVESCNNSCLTAYKKSTQRDASGNKYPLLSTASTVRYNRHQLTLFIADILTQKLNYPYYQSSDENTKHAFAEEVATKISTMMLSRLGLATVHLNQTVKRGFLGIGNPGLVVTQTIEPALPSTANITSSIPTSGFCFVKQSRTENAVNKAASWFDDALDRAAEALFG